MIEEANYFLGEDSSPISKAYWISPTGKVIPVDQTHVLQVIEHPDKFGMDWNDIESVHEKYNEPIGMEGSAREEIVTDLMRNGWIRVRYEPRFFSWTIQLNSTSIQKIPKFIIGSFLAMLIIENPKNKYSGLRILDTSNNELYVGDIDDAINGDAPIVENASGSVSTYINACTYESLWKI